MFSSLRLLDVFTTLLIGILVPFQLFAEESPMSKSPADRVAEKPMEKNVNPVLVIETDQGDVKVRLLCDIAPKACENFIGLAEKGYYNNVIFHRVIKNFMIQGGDPTGTGNGGESLWGSRFADEVSPAVIFDKPGILAMANCGPNTNSSQFFITTAPTMWLNNKHTIFGTVIEGYPVVEKISELPTDSKARPSTPPQIKRIYRVS